MLACWLPPNLLTQCHEWLPKSSLAGANVLRRARKDQTDDSRTGFGGAYASGNGHHDTR